MKKNQFIFFILIFLFISNQANASGSYSPSGAPFTKTSYNEGKAIYHGRIEIEGFPGCVSCHDSKNKLKRKNFQNIGLVVESYLTHCEEQTNCETTHISNLHWESLMYFLQKRYRIQ